MSTTTTLSQSLVEDSEIQRQAEQMRAKADVLVQLRPILDGLTYGAQSDALKEATGERWPTVESYVSVSAYWGREVDVVFMGPAAKEWLRLVRRSIGGFWKKEHNDFNLKLTREFGEVKVSLTVSRDAVCVKEEVEKEVTVPARTADPAEAKRLRERAEKLLADSLALESDQPERVEVQTVAEWSCESIND